MNNYTGGQGQTPCSQGQNQMYSGMMPQTGTGGMNMPNQKQTVLPPTGLPTGPTSGPTPFSLFGQNPPTLSDNLSPITQLNQPAPVTTESLQYFNGFLRTQIGRKVRVDFLIGTNTLLDKAGTLLGVGANYILLQEEQTDDLIVCDYYSIKFVTVYY